MHLAIPMTTPGMLSDAIQKEKTENSEFVVPAITTPQNPADESKSPTRSATLPDNEAKVDGDSFGLFICVWRPFCIRSRESSHRNLQRRPSHPQHLCPIATVHWVGGPTATKLRKIKCNRSKYRWEIDRRAYSGATEWFADAGDHTGRPDAA